MGRDHSAAGRSGAYAKRDRPSPGGCTKGGPLATARRGIAPGKGPRREERRAPGDSLSRGIADSSPAAAADAAIAETDAGNRIGITISKDGGGRRSKILTIGREPGG